MILNAAVLETKGERDMNSTISENFSLINYTFDLLIEGNNSIYNCVYENAKVQNVVTENVDINNVIVKMFGAILKWFKGLLQKVLNTFINFIIEIGATGKGTWAIMLKKYENKIKNFRGTLNYNNPLHIYTNLDANTPPPDLNESLKAYSSTLLGTMSEINAIDPSDEDSIRFKLSDLANDPIYDPDRVLDQFRGDLIGVPEGIKEEEFNKRVYNYFTNGGKPIENAKIVDTGDGYIYRTYYLTFKDGDKQLKKIKKENNAMQKSAEAAIKSIEKKLCNPSAKIKKNTEWKKQAEEDVKTITKNAVNILQQKCQTISIVYGQKMDAITQQKVQSKKILIAVIEAIKKEEGRNLVNGLSR